MSYYGVAEALIGKTIETVTHDKAKGVVRFSFREGPDVVVDAEGDCCSHSWIELVEIPTGIRGAKITALEDSDTVREATPEELAKADCLSVYQTMIRTTKGDISLEFRNDSNGYYGGYLVLGSLT